MDTSSFPDVRKIAVFRATAIGDLIFALPALDALRAAYPSAEIVYLGREWHTAFLPGRLAGPHRVIAVPPARTREQIAQGLVIDPDAAGAFFERMRAEQFDLAVQMHGGGEYSNPFVRELGARFTVGLKSARAAPLDRSVPYHYYQNETARMLEVAALAGAAVKSSDLLPRLAVLPADLEAAAPVLDSLSGPFAVLHPGSTDPRRCWSPEKFAELGDALAGRGLQVLLTGTSMDQERIEAVRAAMRAPARSLQDQLSLSGLVGMLSRADLFAGNDSGPLHLALAAGARSVGLFWVEYILNSMPLTRRSFAPLIAWSRTCPNCGRYCLKDEIDSPSGPCAHEVSFIEEIQPGPVIEAAGNLLG